MKKILFIAPASFPVGDAEAIVNIKLLQSLSKTGQFEIDLISKKYKYLNYPISSFESYGVKVNSLNIVESDNVINFETLWKTFIGLLKFGTAFKGSHWALEVLPIVKRLIHNNKYDYVVTKNLASYLLGAYIQKKYGIKWIATWNDPHPDSKYPHPYGKGQNYRSLLNNLEINIIKKADIHLFPSKRLANYMNNYLHIDESKIIIAPHVVQSDVAVKRNTNKTECLRIIHSGNLMSPRNPMTFLEGLKMFKTSNKDAKIEFHILGKMDSSINDCIANMGLDNNVKYLNPVEYTQSLKLLNQYDVALIIEADCSEGIFLPTKVSDFMQSGIPIFSVSPSIGVLNDLYLNGNIPYFAPIDNSDEIYQVISKLYMDFQNKSIKENHIPEEFFDSHICNLYAEF